MAIRETPQFPGPAVLGSAVDDRRLPDLTVAPPLPQQGLGRENSSGTGVVDRLVVEDEVLVEIERAVESIPGDAVHSGYQRL